MLFVGEGDPDGLARDARRVLELARPCFRMDADLRPEGRDGPLVRSVGSYAAHWQRWAQPWERQALLKARPVAGDPALGRAWADAAADALWSRPVDADDIRAVRDMKRRAEDEVSRRGLSDREIKRGPGGIRDIEFALQLLQLVHGRLDEALRTPTTLRALAELQAAGYVGLDDADQLGAAYRFLRRVEHVLQLEDEHQVHVVPDATPTRARPGPDPGLPQRGHRRRPSSTSTPTSPRHRAAARAIHERLWFRPLLEAFAASRRTLSVGLSPDATAERLAAFGFADVERTRAAVADLTRGLTRSSRLMQQLLPLVLDWLSETPDPDLGLLTLRRLTERPDRATQLAATFRESPDVARALCQVIGTSEHLGEVLRRNPDLIPRLSAPDDLRTRSGPELVRQRRRRRWGGGPTRTTARRRCSVGSSATCSGIAARDLLGHAATARVGRDLATLAEATLEVALATLEPALPFAVVAVGRFGGQELSYASDLDVVFVYDGAGPEDAGGGRAAGLGAPAPARRFPGPADLARRRRPAPGGPPGPAGPQPGRLPHLLRPLGPDLGAPGA